MQKFLDAIIIFMFRLNVRGRNRLVRWIRHHQPYHLSRVVTKHGLQLNLNPEDYMDDIVLKTGYFEEEVLESLLENVGEEGVLWDIGANIGLHALTIKRLRPRVRVTCFEPSPFTFSRLYLNAEQNGGGVQLINIGLGNDSGYANLSLQIIGNSGLTSFKPWKDVTYQRSMLSYCDTAHHLVMSGVVPAPTIVKIDVEGFELEVLSGFKDLLQNPQLRTFVFESPEDFLDRPNQYPVHQLLREAGFQISSLSPKNANEKIRPTNFCAKR